MDIRFLQEHPTREDADFCCYMLAKAIVFSGQSAGSHGDQCRCGLATRLVGDGCEHCNPAMTIDILREQVAEMRLTDAEREAISAAACICEDAGRTEIAVSINTALERLG
jgi:hypothetical protein